MDILPKSAEKNLTLPDRVYYRRGDHGFVEVVCSDTGAVLMVQNSYGVVPEKEFISAEIDGQTVLLAGVGASDIQLRRKYPYSQVLADIIVQKIIEGVPLSKIHLEKGMPSLYDISRWRESHPDFNKAILSAKRARTERLRDEIMAEAEAAKGKPAEFVASHKLKIEALRWAVEKENPSEYGNKVEHSGSIGVTHLVIETGIRRAGDPGFESPKKDITPLLQEEDLSASPMLLEEKPIDSSAPCEVLAQSNCE